MNVELQLKDFTSFSNNLEKRITDKSRELLKLLGDELEPLVKQESPVDTGLLQSSINVGQIVGDERPMYSVYYGIYVNYGTSKMEPREFVQKSFERLRFDSIISEIMKRV